MSDDIPTLWDLKEGQRLRDEGMAKVTENTSERYREEFATVVRDFREQHRDYTSEDVTARIGFPDAHPNAVGAITRAMSMRYGAVKVGHVKAQRSGRHANEIALWGWR